MTLSNHNKDLKYECLPINGLPIHDINSWQSIYDMSTIVLFINGR